MAGSLSTAQPNRIAPAGESSHAPQRLVGSPVAGAVYVVGEDESYFLTQSQLREAQKATEELDEKKKKFIEKVEHAAHDEHGKAEVEKEAGEEKKKVEAMVEGIDSKKTITEIRFLTSGRPRIAFVPKAVKDKWSGSKVPANPSQLSKRDQKTLDRKGEKGLEKRLKYRERKAEKKLQQREVKERSAYERTKDGKRVQKRDPKAIRERWLQTEIALKAEWKKEGKLIDWAPEFTLKGEHYDYSEGAQFMRYTAGASAGIVFDPSKMNFKVAGEAKASFALAEAELKAYYYFPDREGFKLTASRPGHQVHLCSLRFAAFIKLQGFVGANAAVSVNLGLQVNKGKVTAIGMKSEKGEEKSGKKGEQGKKEHEEPQGEVIEAGAFAGAQFSCAVGGSLQWNSKTMGEEWKDLAECKYTGNLAAGIGFEAGVKVTFEGGKFVFYAELRLIVGVGGGGALGFTVDAKQVYDFIKLLYEELRRGDFGFVEWISKEAFHHWTAILYYAFVGPQIVMGAIAQNAWKLASEAWTHYSQAEDQAKDIATRILADPSLLTFATPETRGRLLYDLTHPSLLPELFVAARERREAIVKIFETIQSLREWYATLNNVIPAPGHWLGTEEGTNLDGHDQQVFAMSRLMKLFDSDTLRHFHNWRQHLPNTESHLRENVSKSPEQVNRWKQG
jgi:hypothetical protein